MKFTKPSGKSFEDTALLTGGALGGGLASNVVIGLIHKPKADPATDAAAAKKEENMLLVKRAAIVAASLLGASAVDGKDGAAMAVKGAFAGMVVVQGIEVAKTLLVRSGAIKSNDSIAAKAIGLGCTTFPTSGLGEPYTPYFYDYAPLEQINATKSNDFSMHPVALAVEAQKA